MNIYVCAYIYVSVTYISISMVILSRRRLTISPFYRWGNWAAARLNDFLSFHSLNNVAAGMEVNSETLILSHFQTITIHCLWYKKVGASRGPVSWGLWTLSPTSEHLLHWREVQYFDIFQESSVMV